MFGAGARARAGTRTCASQEAPRFPPAADGGDGCFVAHAAPGAASGCTPPPGPGLAGVPDSPPPALRPHLT